MEDKYSTEYMPKRLIGYTRISRTSPAFADEPDCFFTDVHAKDSEVPRTS